MSGFNPVGPSPSAVFTVALLTLAAACGSEPTDENVSFAEAIVQGAVTESSGAPVVGAVVWVLQNESLGRECTGEYGGGAGADTTDGAGGYSLVSLHLTDDTLCVGIRVTPPDSTGLAQRFVQEILLPYRYPKLEALDTVRVDLVLEPQPLSRK